MFLVYLILGIPLMYYVMKLCVWLSERRRKMKKNKFWILFGLTVLLSLGSQLLAQANRILTLAPTAQTSSIGNVCYQ